MECVTGLLPDDSRLAQRLKCLKRIANATEALGSVDNYLSAMIVAAMLLVAA